MFEYGAVVRGKITLFLVIFFLAYGVCYADTLNIGSISSYPKQEIKQFLPLANYLENRLRLDGVTKVKIIIAKNAQQMAEFLRNHQVDIYIDSPFPVIALSKKTGCRIVLRRWKKGIGEYHTVIFSRKNSTIKTLMDLKGKRIAFEKPYSSSGYLLPKMMLQKKGFEMIQIQKAAKKQLPMLDRIGYLFSNEDENTLFWVLRGKVSAGAMDNQNFVTLARENIKKFIVLDRSNSIPRQLVAFRRELPVDLGKRVKAELLSMARHEAGRKVLLAFERTAKFDEIPDGSLDELMQADNFLSSEFKIK